MATPSTARHCCACVDNRPDRKPIPATPWLPPATLRPASAHWP
jgi:hypothetical protein